MNDEVKGGIRRLLPLTAIGSSACTASALYHYPCNKYLDGYIF